MPSQFSDIDFGSVRQLRQFKIDYRRVRNLDYIDQDQRSPQSFAEFRRVAVRRPLEMTHQPRPKFDPGLKNLSKFTTLYFLKPKILVLVNQTLYPSVKDAIDQYVRDVAYEGYYADVYSMQQGTAQELRSFIHGKLPLAGALLVGNLPVAWFEMDDDFHGAHSEFPCDLYFMDQNGTWSDPDNDGKFSQHPTNVEPELWISRLWTPTNNGNDASLINDYFRRNHEFRKGQLGCSNRALAYVDDDWAGFDDCAFDQMFLPADIETITDATSTDADRYKAEINEHRAWAQVCAHSSPGGHSFKVPNGTEWVPASYLRDINPADAFFYNLFACSNARFTQADYMAGWYIFDKTGDSRASGLVAVGSSKSGSMLMFENFYGPMGSGKTIGEAYLEWWKALGATHELWERQWFYGMVLLGDPTLNWWTGVVPTLRNPYDGDVFDHFPRRMRFRWDPIALGGAVYNVEIDAFGARAAGKWAAEVGQTWFVTGALMDTSYEHMFVGAQPGRWRVRAKVGNRVCPWSDWHYFEYTV
ncbi:MAG TPA: hypothetical protein PLO37_18085 [Candidatus Hydrogenedentes bacterium]|nr:hypothetical protein [Candidatus Hydrogenedentota bacterium]HPG68761.1 hypothetical protein [Candidatus Hydrogenedentota bacterium]